MSSLHACQNTYDVLAEVASYLYPLSVSDAASFVQFLKQTAADYIKNFDASSHVSVDEFDIPVHANNYYL